MANNPNEIAYKYDSSTGKFIEEVKIGKINSNDCSDNNLNKRSTIISGFNSLKKIGPKYSIGKNVISYLVG